MRGRNAIGGAINYYTKKPTDEWDALVIAEVTDQMTQRVNVAFGGPLSDHFSFRITGGYFVGDGAQENVGFGGDYDEPDQRSISPQLRFKTDRLDINLRYGYVEDTGAPRTPISISDRVRDVECAEFPGLTSASLINGCHPNNWYLYEGSVPSIDANCPPNVVGFKCGKLKNITNVNAPGIPGQPPRNGNRLCHVRSHGDPDAALQLRLGGYCSKQQSRQRQYEQSQ